MLGPPPPPPEPTPPILPPGPPPTPPPRPGRSSWLLSSPLPKQNRIMKNSGILNVRFFIKNESSMYLERSNEYL